MTNHESRASTRPLRVLIEAYACEPDAGSEPGIGWNWSIEAARHGHQVTTITRANNRRRIEAALDGSPIPGLAFHYVDLPRPFLRMKKRLGYLGLHLYYYLWQIRVCMVARKLHATRPFDLAHHVTFGNDWMPSGVAGVRAPFIWGPVGGSTHVLPRAMKDALPRVFRRHETIRWWFQTSLGRFDPLVALTRRRADLILTYSEEALAGIPRRHLHKARAIVHIGVLESDAPTTSRGQAPPPPFTVVSGGRLVHWKGFDLLVRGFLKFVEETGSEARLLLTGEGPYRHVLQGFVERTSVGDRVRFLGSLPRRADVYRVLDRAHLYALPTLRDGPPVSIVEAMLAAKPVLCLDLGATRELVPASAGLKIPAGSAEEMIDSIASALQWADEHLPELHERGLAARAHALAVHDWRRIGDEVESLYRAVQSRSIQVGSDVERHRAQ